MSESIIKAPYAADAGAGIEISGNTISLRTSIIADVNLDNIDYYFFGYGRNLTSIPSGSTSAGFIVSLIRSNANAYRKQFYMPYNTDEVYRRTCNNGTWSAWSQL